MSQLLDLLCTQSFKFIFSQSRSIVDLPDLSFKVLHSVKANCLICLKLTAHNKDIVRSLNIKYLSDQYKILLHHKYSKCYKDCAISIFYSLVCS